MNKNFLKIKKHNVYHLLEEGEIENNNDNNNEKEEINNDAASSHSSSSNSSSSESESDESFNDTLKKIHVHFYGKELAPKSYPRKNVLVLIPKEKFQLLPLLQL